MSARRVVGSILLVLGVLTLLSLVMGVAGGTMPPAAIGVNLAIAALLIGGGYTLRKAKTVT